MSRYAAPLGVLVLACSPFIGQADLQAQHVAFESMSVASTSGSGITDLFDDPAASPSDVVLRAAPSGYFENSRSQNSVSRLSSGSPSSSRQTVENWMVVCSLGAAFSFGLVLTAATIRKKNRQMPRPIF